MSLHPSSIARYAAMAAAAVFGAACLAHAEALRAAGVNGKAPENANAIKTFVSTITDNALWIIGTTAGLAIAVVGGMFFFGHSRAADYALRMLIGSVIIVSAAGAAA